MNYLSVFTHVTQESFCFVHAAEKPGPEHATRILLSDSEVVLSVDARTCPTSIFFMPIITRSWDATSDDEDFAYLPAKIMSAINLCPPATRPQLWKNIVLCGGNALLPGFKERLEAELSAISDGNVVRVSMPVTSSGLEHLQLTWVAASHFASKTVAHNWFDPVFALDSVYLYVEMMLNLTRFVSKESYLRSGPGIFSQEARREWQSQDLSGTDIQYDMDAEAERQDMMQEIEDALGVEPQEEAVEVTESRVLHRSKSRESIVFNELEALFENDKASRSEELKGVSSIQPNAHMSAYVRT